MLNGYYGVMSVSFKAEVARYAFFVNTAGTIILFMQNSEYFWVGVFMAPLIGLYTLTLNCPKCGLNVHMSQRKLAGQSVWYYSPQIHRTCERCGEDLSSPS